MTSPSIEPAYRVLLPLAGLAAMGLAAGLVTSALLVERVGRRATAIGFAVVGFAAIGFWFTAFSPSLFWRTLDGTAHVRIMLAGWVALGLGTAFCARAVSVDGWRPPEPQA